MKEKTRAGQWLQGLGDAGKPILQAVAGLTGQQWLNGVAEHITTSKEIAEQKKKEFIELYALDLQDLANARDHNIKIQTSEKVPLFAKLFPFIYESVAVFVWAVVTVYLIMCFTGYLKLPTAEMIAGIMGIYGALSQYVTTIFNFHRGSSEGSKEKSRLK